MTESMIEIHSEPLGKGRERTCYQHPHDASRLIKIPSTDINTQTRREIDFYRRLQRRGGVQYTQIPAFYGSVETNLGQGIVVDLISDIDGSVSKTMRWYLERDMSIQAFEPYLDELRAFLLRNEVIINHDLVLGNILLQKYAQDRQRLVIIDGIGDVVRIQWLNRFSSHVRAKIERRWARFIKHIYRCPEVTRYLS